MKKLSMILGIFLFSTVSLQPLSFAKITSSQQPERWCPPDSSYNSAHENNIEILRFSLFAFSQLAKEKNHRKEIEPLLTKIVDASVFSLANVLSLRADFEQYCSVKADEYNNEMMKNEQFISLFLFSFFSEGLFPFMIKIQENNWDKLGFIGHGQPILKNPEVIQSDKKIAKRLKKWKKYKSGSQENAVTVAARLLLGEKVEWDERTLKPANRFRFNPDNNPANQKSYSAALSWLEKSTVRETFQRLSTYYVQTAPKNYRQ